MYCENATTIITLLITISLTRVTLTNNLRKGTKVQVTNNSIPTTHDDTQI